MGRRVCIDRIVPKPAIADMGLEAAVETSLLWSPGQTLSVAFLEGSKAVRAKVRKYAVEWSQYASINSAIVVP